MPAIGICSVRHSAAPCQCKPDVISVLDRIELLAGATHQIVRDYLVHYGYADTLAAFDSAAGVIPGTQDDDIGPSSCVRIDFILMMDSYDDLEQTPTHAKPCLSTDLVHFPCGRWHVSKFARCPVFSCCDLTASPVVMTTTLHLSA